MFICFLETRKDRGMAKTEMDSTPDPAQSHHGSYIALPFTILHSKLAKRWLEMEQITGLSRRKMVMMAAVRLLDHLDAALKGYRIVILDKNGKQVGKFKTIKMAQPSESG